jgi:hypothetical protein
MSGCGGKRAQGTRHNAITAYAAECAGTSVDLDTNLKAAGIEHLMNTGTNTR